MDDIGRTGFARAGNGARVTRINFNVVASKPERTRNLGSRARGKFRCGPGQQFGLEGLSFLRQRMRERDSLGEQAER